MVVRPPPFILADSLSASALPDLNTPCGHERALRPMRAWHSPPYTTPSTDFMGVGLSGGHEAADQFTPDATRDEIDVAAGHRIGVAHRQDELVRFGIEDHDSSLAIVRHDLH